MSGSIGSGARARLHLGDGDFGQFSGNDSTRRTAKFRYP
jgi:hypothetical protein